jgi:hypothetical protein
MVTAHGEIRLEPTVVYIDDLLADVSAGRLRVPDFQRPFEWRPDQMLDLFDSIERGYPIGSLLLWQTDAPVSSIDSIGDIRVPDVPPGTEVSYVLDGHQRLSTLFGTLRRTAPLSGGVDSHDWKWAIHRDLEPRTQAERYRHHRPSSPHKSEPPEQYLPLRLITRTMDFLSFSRHLEIKIRDRDRLTSLIEQAEAVAQRIKGYKITLIRLRGASLGEAVEVYTRLNRKGMRMDADQMVSALTHRSERPTLASRIDDIVTSVADTGFGAVPRMAVFRTVLAVAGEPDVMSPRWEAVAYRLQDRLHDAVPAAEQAVRRAVDFLRGKVRLPLARLLPYAHQLTLLAMFFHHRQTPTDAQAAALRRWFWVTSWASTFAGANSTTIRQALQEMRDFATDGVPPALDLARVRPMPDTFNFNSARTRAYVAWEMVELNKRFDILGQEIDLIKALASAESQPYRAVVPGDRRPANRLVLPTTPGLTLQAALTEQLSEHADDVLESHGIPRTAWHRLREGNGKAFVDDRAALLGRRLREFAHGLGVPLGPDLEGIADDDTE